MAVHVPEITHAQVPTNGIHLHVAQAGSPDGKLVIFLHGFPEAWFGWKRQIPYFAERGYRVWAPDQRGYNESDKPRWVAQYSIDELAKDVVGLIDAAGASRAYLVGHDWGGAVTWRTAQLFPERLEKIAVMNVPHPSVLIKTLMSSPAQLLKSWYVFFFQLPFLPQWWYSANNFDIGVRSLVGSSRRGTFTPDDIQRYREAWARTGDGSSMINWYRAAAQVDRQRLTSRRITVPTLLLWGAKDMFLSREMAPASIDLCDQGRLVMVEQASHWVQHEEADLVNRELDVFFAG